MATFNTALVRLFCFGLVTMLQGEGGTGIVARGYRRRLLLSLAAAKAAHCDTVEEVLPREAHAPLGAVGAVVDATEEAQGDLRRGNNHAVVRYGTGQLRVI